MQTLAIIACYFNFAGYQSLRDNYRRWLHESRWWGVPTYIAEIAFGDEPFVNDSAFIQVRADQRHFLWQKERLLNLIVERLPNRFTRVAWIDADMLFLNRHWVRDTHQALDRFPVVQLFEGWHFEGPDGRLIENQTGVSCGHLGERYKTSRGLPGGAWAARREVFPLYDRQILGGGDSAAVGAWLGVPERGGRPRMSPRQQQDFDAWATTAWAKVRGMMTTIRGDAIHYCHGSRKNRQYWDRTQILLDHQFDPQRHITVDRDGLLSWTATAPQGLRRDIARYFFGRNEDEGIAQADQPQIGERSVVHALN